VAVVMYTEVVTAFIMAFEGNNKSLAGNTAYIRTLCLPHKSLKKRRTPNLLVIIRLSVRSFR